ncbi:hypothetical protein X975_19975, partial [Stegodyphus mimosarum]
MKILIINILLLAAVGCAFGAAVHNCHLEKLTACGDPLAEFRKEMGQSFPTTEDQVKKFCEDMEKAQKCAEDYQNKCMTPMQLETMGFLMEGSITVYKDFCQEGSQLRTEYLKHAKCMDEASKTEEAKNYYSYVEASLEDLSDKPPEKRLPIACCGYQWLTAKSDQLGREKCGQEAVDAFHNVVEMAISALILCSGFDPEGSQCTEVMPPLGSKPKGTLRNS